MTDRPFPFQVTPDDRRYALRAPVSIDAELRRAGRTPFGVVIRDLSRTGCRAETLSRVIEGDRVWITLPGFNALEGIIRWSTVRGFGCEWQSTIHASVFDHIRARYPQIWR